MRLPVRNYLVFHPNPGQRADLRAALDGSAGGVCLGEGAELPASPPPSLARVPLVILLQAEQRARAVLRNLRRWRGICEDLRVLMLLDPGESDLVVPLLDSGASAFVSSQDWLRELSAALEALQLGGVFVSGGLARAAFAPAPCSESDQSDIYGLTPREREILVMIALGLSNKDAARRLKLSVRTVETHRLNIRKKTRASSRRDLFVVADKLGLIVGYGTPRGLAEHRLASGYLDN